MEDLQRFVLRGSTFNVLLLLKQAGDSFTYEATGVDTPALFETAEKALANAKAALMALFELHDDAMLAGQVDHFR